MLKLIRYGLAWLARLANMPARFGFIGFVVAAAMGAAFGSIVTWHLRCMEQVRREECEPLSSTTA